MTKKMHIGNLNMMGLYICFQKRMTSVNCNWEGCIGIMARESVVTKVRIRHRLTLSMLQYGVGKYKVDFILAEWGLNRSRVKESNLNNILK